MDPLRVRMERVLSPTEAVVDGQRTMMVGTNNYLGLTFDAELHRGARRGAAQRGTGTTGSRIANGSYDQHEALERELADFYGKQHCMVFIDRLSRPISAPSPPWSGAGDYLIIDADSHASIYDACKHAAATVIRFRHNDPVDLDKRLRRLNDATGNKLVVVEGIYSMLGDKAPLKEIVAVNKRHGAYLLVDEAHSMGVLGENGRGLVEEAGIRPRSISSSAPSPRAWARSAASASPTIRTSRSCACCAALHVHRLAAALDHRLGAPGAARGAGAARAAHAAVAQRVGAL